MHKSSTSKSTDYIRLIALNIVILSLLLVFIEGLASYVLIARDIMRTYPLAERRHIKYDSDLGWANAPSVRIPDLYGSGVHFTTNSQGFRNHHDFETRVPQGKYRIICSGDSFTLGYGVDNDHTWCQLLTSLDTRFETLNMGQGGYGVDQAYLWYKRDASKFEYQVHLLAFITEDFDRMQSDRFLGYSKPLITLENGRLVVNNVPVPERAYDLAWLTLRTEKLKRLRAVELSERISRKIGLVSDLTRRSSQKENNAKTREVLRKIFEDLKRLNEERSSQLALLYLPTLPESRGNAPEEWMQFIEKESRALGIPLINLLRTFRSLPYEEVVKMFIPAGQIQYYGAAGHLNAQGNEFVARRINEAFQNHPALFQALSLHQRN
jgi:lysophospholipase L1-like esterase